MSFEIEMVVPGKGTDDLGSEAQASMTFLRYTLRLRHRDDRSALGPLEVVYERIAEATDRVADGVRDRPLVVRGLPGTWRASNGSDASLVPLFSYLGGTGRGGRGPTPEAWLLIDEAAIRAACGRISGREARGLPAVSRLEQVSDPKAVLFEALVVAHGASGRRARRFSPDAARNRLADLVQDWSRLRGASAFRRLEEDTRAALVQIGLPLRPRES